MSRNTNDNNGKCSSNDDGNNNNSDDNDDGKKEVELAKVSVMSNFNFAQRLAIFWKAWHIVYIAGVHNKWTHTTKHKHIFVYR